MSQSAPAEPIVTSPYQPSPPLGALVAAIREYVSAVQLGEDKNRRLDLSRRVWQLCWTCRPKHGEREMRFTNGMLAHVVLDYSTTHVEWKDSERHVVSSLCRGRRHADMPSELDGELDRIEDEMTRAGIEAAYDIRMPDENGRPLPVPAIDRLLVIADRIESQEGNDGSEAKEQRHETSRCSSPTMALVQFGKALGMDPYRDFRPKAKKKWGLLAENKAATKWTIDYNKLNDSGKEALIDAHARVLQDKREKK